MTEYEKLAARFQPHMDKAEQTSEKLGTAFYGFVKTLVTIAAGLIAVLVSLKGDLPQDECRKLLFTFTIGTLSLGIVFGVLLLYTEVVVYDSLLKSQKAEILELLKGDKKDILIAEGSPGVWYELGKWGMSLSFLLSLICLTIYSYH